MNDWVSPLKKVNKLPQKTSFQGYVSPLKKIEKSPHKASFQQIDHNNETVYNKLRNDSGIF